MATIIKSTDKTPAGTVAAYRLDELSSTAAGQLSGRSQQAADILAQAQRDADEIRRRAEAEGRRAAEQILEERVGQHLATLLPAVRDAVDRIAAAKTEWLAHWERTAVHVAAEIAQRLIRRELSRAPDITLALVKEALELAAGSGDLQLRLHPEDFETLGQHAGRLAKELNRLGHVDIVADPAISKGGCRVDSRFGTIDQQFEAQLARIEQELT